MCICMYVCVCEYIFSVLRFLLMSRHAAKCSVSSSRSNGKWLCVFVCVCVCVRKRGGGGGGGGRRGGGSRSGGCGDDRTDVGEQYAEFSKVCSLLKSVPQITIELTFEKFLRQMTICHTCTHMHTHTLSLSHTHTHTHTRTPTHPHSPYATS